MPALPRYTSAPSTGIIVPGHATKLVPSMKNGESTAQPRYTIGVNEGVRVTVTVADTVAENDTVGDDDAVAEYVGVTVGVVVRVKEGKAERDAESDGVTDGDVVTDCVRDVEALVEPDALAVVVEECDVDAVALDDGVYEGVGNSVLDGVGVGSTNSTRPTGAANMARKPGLTTQSASVISLVA
jgi:hypothetical protein